MRRPPAWRSRAGGLAAVAGLAALLATGGTASGAPLLAGPPAPTGVTVHGGADGPATLLVSVRHPGLAQAAVGRFHRANATRLGVVRITVPNGPNGATFTAGDREPLLLGPAGAGGPPQRALHRIDLPDDDADRLRALVAAGAQARVTASGRLALDGRGRPLEAVTGQRGLRLPPVSEWVPGSPDGPVVRCERARSTASSLRATTIAVRCAGDSPSLTLVRGPQQGTARVVSSGGSRLLVSYRAPRGFVGQDALVVRASNAAGAMSVRHPVVVRPFRLRAIGDSVTAGFGFLGSGIEWSVLDLVSCIPPTPLNDRCSSNSPNGPGVDGPVGWSPDFGLANNVAWPAQFANARGIPSGPTFQNWAVSGSTPADWDRGGALNSILAGIVQGQPDLTVMTLGANPLLDLFLAGRGIGCAVTLTDAELRACVRGFIRRQRLVPRVRSVVNQLLVAPSNRVVVSQYHQAIPTATLFSVSSLRIMFGELNAAVARAVRGMPQFGSRVYLMSPPLFPVGLGPGIVLCPSGSGLVDGQSRQSRVSQDALTVTHPFTFCGSDDFWIISADSGIHPNRNGHAQFAAALGRVVDQEGLMAPAR